MRNLADIDAYVDAYDFGTPDAVKRGRNPKWPHVPIIRAPEHSAFRAQTRQVLGLAFATRAEAIAAAAKAIEQQRETLRAELRRPNYRALRDWHGFPREMAS